MSKRHGDIKGIEWRLLDVCNMDSITSGSIDVAFDKGTLDAMIHGSPWSPPQDVVDKTAAYIQEVSGDCLASAWRSFPSLTLDLGISCPQK